MTSERSAGPDAGVLDDARQPTSRVSGRVGLARMLAIAVVVVAADQLSKWWALHRLSGRAPLHVIWTLQFNLSFNSGMAFSQGQGIGPIIGAIAIVVVIGLALSVRKVGSRTANVAAGLVIGGAVGNLADRVFRDDGWLHGAVIDFVDLQWFPIFNVADAAITIGGALFVLWSLRSRPAAQR